jgi:hypothetical protein
MKNHPYLWLYVVFAIAGGILPVASPTEWGMYLLMGGMISSVVLAMLAAVDMKSSNSLSSRQQVASFLLLGVEDPKAEIPSTKMRTAFLCCAVFTVFMAISVLCIAVTVA